VLENLRVTPLVTTLLSPLMTSFTVTTHPAFVC
jgi:hypothetical protein